jgi:hypothetical protein
MSFLRWIASASILGLAMPAASQEVAIGSGAMLRGLDKTNAAVSDLELANGGEVFFGPLSVRMTECRYPEGDLAADAYAFLVIRDMPREKTIFSGWMLASSPALNALEHPRYDVWVLRCTTE